MPVVVKMPRSLKTYNGRGERNGGKGDGLHVEFVSIATCASTLTRRCNRGSEQYT